MKPEFIEAITEDGWWEDAPTLFNHWVRGVEQIHEPGDWNHPIVPDSFYEMSDWNFLGWAPKPRGRWQAFWFHYHQGRLMRYPLASVIAFALRYSAVGE